MTTNPNPQGNQGNQPVEPVPEGTTPLGAAKGDMTQNIDTTGTDQPGPSANPNAAQDENPLYRDDNPQANLGQEQPQQPVNFGNEKTNMGQMDDGEKQEFQQSLKENEQRVDENSGASDTTSKGPNPQTTDTSSS
jgi:hypothetical protein